jgi:hypothetical protein
MKFILILSLISSSVLAQNIASQPLINVVTDQSVVLSDFRAAKAVVVIFTSNVCAYDGYYAERLRALFAAYNANVKFLLVNSHQEPEEMPDKMKSKYDLAAFGVPYLADKDQLWMKALGARKTPEVFVLDPSAEFKVVYSGAIDDNPQLANAVKDSFLKKALDNVLAGKAVAPGTTRTVGCSIRLK